MSLPISFEFFPTKTPEGALRQKEVRQALYAKKPEFCSVTFGAGGSTQTGTLARNWVSSWRMITRPYVRHYATQQVSRHPKSRLSGHMDKPFAISPKPHPASQVYRVLGIPSK